MARTFRRPKTKPKFPRVPVPKPTKVHKNKKKEPSKFIEPLDYFENEVDYLEDFEDFDDNGI
jgi:hypothetical protein